MIEQLFEVRRLKALSKNKPIYSKEMDPGGQLGMVLKRTPFLTIAERFIVCLNLIHRGEYIKLSDFVNCNSGLT